MGVVQRLFGGQQRTAFADRKEPVLARNGSASADDRLWSDGWYSSPTHTGIGINMQTSMQVGTVLSCVSTIAEDVAKLQPEIYRRRADGGADVAKNHPIRPLLTKPNTWQTWFEFAMMQISALLLRGNSYAVILRNGRGDPIMWVPINPDRVTLWEAPDGELFFVVTRTGLHELAILKNVPLYVPYEDVMHWKGLSGNGLLGMSKIAMCREAIGLAAAMEQLASRTIGSGANPSGVLQSDKKVSKETAENLKEQWQQYKSGLNNAGKLLVLEDGLKWEKMSLTFADLQFLASRQYQDVDIARIFRVPGYMIGIDSKGTRANLTQQAQEYLNNTLMTYVDIIEQRMGFTFDLGADYFVRLDLSKILRADIGSRYAAYRIGQTGWLTTNEIRLSEGLNPIEGGDEIMRPVNVAPLNSDVFMGENLDPNAPPTDPNQPGLGSEQTGTGAEGGGRPPEDGTDPAPSD